MKAKYRHWTLCGLLSLVICFFSAVPAAGTEIIAPHQQMYAWQSASGQSELEAGAASRGWPGVRPRQHYPPYYYYPPYHPYHPYPRHYHHPGYERERTWYEGDLPTSAGRLFFLVEPVQAKAFINGYPLSRHADLSYEISLLKGEHELEVRAEGYEPYHRAIEIRGGEQIRLTIKLERTGGH